MQNNQSEAHPYLTPGKYLTFKLKEQFYAVPISAVREINQMSEITAVPQSPVFFKGVMNLRGRTIPVIDLRIRLGLENGKISRETCIVVVEVEGHAVGAIVDSVSEVVDLAQNQLEEPPHIQNRSQERFMMGLGKREGHIIILLNLVLVMNDDSVHNHHDATQPAKSAS